MPASHWSMVRRTIALSASIRRAAPARVSCYGAWARARRPDLRTIRRVVLARWRAHRAHLIAAVAVLLVAAGAAKVNPAWMTSDFPVALALASFVGLLVAVADVEAELWRTRAARRRAIEGLAAGVNDVVLTTPLMTDFDALRAAANAGVRLPEDTYLTDLLERGRTGEFGPIHGRWRQLVDELGSMPAQLAPWSAIYAADAGEQARTCVVQVIAAIDRATDNASFLDVLNESHQGSVRRGEPEATRSGLEDQMRETFDRLCDGLEQIRKSIEQLDEELGSHSVQEFVAARAAERKKRRAEEQGALAVLIANARQMAETLGDAGSLLRPLQLPALRTRLETARDVGMHVDPQAFRGVSNDMRAAHRRLTYGDCFDALSIVGEVEQGKAASDAEDHLSDLIRRVPADLAALEAFRIPPE